MLELTAARLAFFEIERGDQLGVFVRNPKLTGLRRMDDRLINGDQIEIRKASAQLQTMALCESKVTRLGEPEGELFAEVLKERGNALDQFGEILPKKTLKADWLASADQMLAGEFRQHFDVAEDVAAREIGLGRSFVAVLWMTSTTPRL